ncbi:hypothetical protein [Sciscionella marina]|uniref:hypothetical protein n=1 Tax=Sciscionella marina TaxID=508770 RepID=UPI0003768300|nr:hypothetical protein [Sciscionella marina]
MTDAKAAGLYPGLGQTFAQMLAGPQDSPDGNAAAEAATPPERGTGEVLIRYPWERHPHWQASWLADQGPRSDHFESEYFWEVLHWALARTPRVFLIESDQGKTPLPGSETEHAADGSCVVGECRVREHLANDHAASHQNYLQLTQAIDDLAERIHELRAEQREHTLRFDDIDTQLRSLTRTIEQLHPNPAETQRSDQPGS